MVGINLKNLFVTFISHHHHLLIFLDGHCIYFLFFVLIVRISVFFLAYQRQDNDLTKKIRKSLTLWCKIFKGTFHCNLKVLCEMTSFQDLEKMLTTFIVLIMISTRLFPLWSLSTVHTKILKWLDIEILSGILSSYQVIFLLLIQWSFCSVLLLIRWSFKEIALIFFLTNS